MMRVGIAADHGGFVLKVEIAEALRTAGHEVVDFGARVLTPGDDYPDYERARSCKTAGVLSGRVRIQDAGGS